MPRCHVRAASPIPVTAGPPRSQSSGAGFSGECRRKPQNPIRGGPCPPRAPPLLCGCFLVRNTPRGRSFVRRMPEKTAESNSRWALPPRAPPLLCGCFPARNTERGRSFVRRMPEKTAESDSRRVLPTRAPLLLYRCLHGMGSAAKETPAPKPRLWGGHCLSYPARNSRRYSRGLQ